MRDLPEKPGKSRAFFIQLVNLAAAGIRLAPTGELVTCLRPVGLALRVLGRLLLACAAAAAGLMIQPAQPVQAAAIVVNTLHGGLEMRNNTLVNNLSIWGGLGGKAQVYAWEGALYNNNIIALGGSPAKSEVAQGNCEVELLSVMGNLSTDESCQSEPVAFEDLVLGEPDTYGGEIPVIPLLTGSVAIDAAEAEFCTETDTRGVAVRSWMAVTLALMSSAAPRGAGP